MTTALANPDDSNIDYIRSLLSSFTRNIHPAVLHLVVHPLVLHPHPPQEN